MRSRSFLLFALIYLGLSVLPVYPRVLRVEIASRNDVLGGKAFGDAGSYERITGRVYFSLPVNNRHNERIVDLKKRGQFEKRRGGIFRRLHRRSSERSGEEQRFDAARSSQSRTQSHPCAG